MDQRKILLFFFSFTIVADIFIIIILLLLLLFKSFPRNSNEHTFGMFGQGDTETKTFPFRANRSLNFFKSLISSVDPKIQRWIHFCPQPVVVLPANDPQKYRPSNLRCVFYNLKLSFVVQSVCVLMASMQLNGWLCRCCSFF